MHTFEVWIGYYDGSIHYSIGTYKDWETIVAAADDLIISRLAVIVVIRTTQPPQPLPENNTLLAQWTMGADQPIHWIIEITDGNESGACQKRARPSKNKGMLS